MTATALRLAAVLAAVGFAVALLIWSPVGAPMAANNTVQAAADVLVGLALIGLGIAIAVTGPSRAAGGPGVVVGFAWLGALFASMVVGDDPLRGPGLALEELRSPGLFALVVVIASSERRQAAFAWTSGSFFAVAVVLATLRLATYDPFADATCVQCVHGAPILHITPGQQDWLRQMAGVVAVAAAAGLLAGAAWVALRRRLRGPRLAIVGGAAICGLAAAASSFLTLVRAPLATATAPPQNLAGAIDTAVTLGGGLLVLGLGWFIVDAVRVRVRLRQLADEIVTAAELGSLERRLARAFGDEQLIVAYWLADEGRFVSSSGLPVERPPGIDDAEMAIERGGKLIAAIWPGGRLDRAAISTELTPSFLVALDNERLQAAGLANLHELQSSRARLMTIQQEQQRRVERDLHDGIQQRALAVVFDLRLARNAVQRRRARSAAAWLARAEALALSLVDEVRRLAHGIHPAVLSQAGLAAALSSLADEAPIPLTVSIDPALALPAPTEAVVYRVIVDALADAVRRGAAELSVGIERHPDAVTVAIDHDGVRASPPMRLVDRIAAALGSLSVDESEQFTGNRMRVTLPCA
jgi:signal transduction histidine kinase